MKNVINIIAVILIMALFIGKAYSAEKNEVCEKKCEPDKSGFSAQVMVCTNTQTGTVRRIWLWKKIDGRPPVPAACTD